MFKVYPRPAQALSGVGGGGGKEAYVTLLYGEAFILGVRVLGQSLRDTGTTRRAAGTVLTFTLWPCHSIQAAAAAH